MRRRSVVVALTLFGCPWAAVSSQAAEMIMDVECSSSVKSSFPPNTERQTVVDSYAPCTSTDSTVKSGTRHLASSLLDLCNVALTEGSGADEIVWNNGTVSTWEYTREVSLTYGSVMIHQTGMITAGAFVGDSATEYLGIVIPGFFLSRGTSGGAGGPDSCEAAEGETHTFATGKLQIIRS
jgi:hypothetical protein